MKCPAKINVGLFVSPQRADGFHDIRSLFLPVSIFDTIEFTESDALSLRCLTQAQEQKQEQKHESERGHEYEHKHEQEQNKNIFIPENDENLVLKAYHALAALDPELKKYQINLYKKIPIQAGLGGGSSDCAQALLFFNRQLTKPLPQHELHHIAKNLGSDVPFFLQNKPAYSEGRGEKLSFLPKIPGLPLLICKPDFHVSTAAAYRLLDQRKHIPWPEFPLSAVINDLQKTGGRNLSTLISNDFLPAITKTHPQLTEIKTHFLQSGALYADLSGSGSAIFAIYPDTKTRDRAAQQITAHIGKIICADTIF